MNIYSNNHIPASQHYFKRYLRFIEWQSRSSTQSDAIHHILPRSMGGSDDSDNLVSLSHKAHLIAHHILWKAFRNSQMTSAFWFMSHILEDGEWIKVNPRKYQQLKQDKSEFQTVLSRAHMNNMWATDRDFMVRQLTASWTDERRASVTGNNNVAKRLSSRKKISKELLGRKMVHTEINREIVTKRVTPEEFDEYVSLGWSPGHGAGNNPPRMVGKNHPRVKEYTIIDPNGVQYLVDISLRVFCSAHNISDDAFRKIGFSGTVKLGRTAGWSIRLNPEE